MANLNLSQFGEKLFVADADHTFIWDTANAISKRVSRNSWLSAGSIATSTPLTISQTWTDAAVAFAAMKIVATDTNSAAGSDFLELYSGTSTQPLRMDINKTGQINIYGTWTDASNYERLSFSAPSAANAIIGTNKGSGGGTARGLDFQTDGVTRLSFSADNITAAISSRDLNIGSLLRFSSLTKVTSSTDGTIKISDYSENGFNRIQFGGTSASFPAIKRVGTELQIVVSNTSAATNVAAGDADLTFIEDRYRRKGAGTPEGVVTAPIGAVYHNTTGGANTSFYVKESGTGNTGWVAK